MRRLLAVAVLAAVATGALAEERGAALYKRCAACHLPSGAGVPGAYPPLTGHLGAVAATPAGRDYLIMAVASGLMGEITVNGTTYRGVMPGQGAAFNDDDLATVLNHVLTSFNGGQLPADWAPLTTAEVAAARARHQGITPREVLGLRAKALPGGATP